MSQPVYVIDANILVSAIVFKSAQPTAAIRKALNNGIFAISESIADEFKTTLLKSKFDPFISLTDRIASLNALMLASKSIVPSISITVCRDPKDNKFLELAVAAGASAIITGDKDLLVLHPFENVPILSPADFLQLF
jgi:putative PIN family toxin of toxin-antitoxin system